MFRNYMLASYMLQAWFFDATVSTPRLVTPPVRTLTLTRYAPVAAAPRLVTPGKLSLVLTRYVPIVNPHDVAYHPGTRHLLATGKQPNVRVRRAPRAPGTHMPNLRQLTLTRYAPTITAAVRSVPATATVLLIRGTPLLAKPKYARPLNRDLLVSFKLPSVIVRYTLTPGKVPLVLESFAPDVAAEEFPSVASYAGEETVDTTSSFPKSEVLV